MKSNLSDYHSYLLRLWRVQGESGPYWRVSLEDVQTGELHGFQDLNEMHLYLEGLPLTNQGNEMVLETQLD